MNNKTIHLSLLFLLCTTMMLAQEKKYEIIGKVLDANNTTVIEDANIYIIDLKKNIVIHTAKSDTDGNFKISFEKGNYNISIGHNDYEVKLMTIDYSKFNNNTLDLKDVLIEPLKVNELDEVVIVSKDFRIENKNNKKIYHIGNKLKDVAGSMSNLLSYLPSVSVDIDGTVQIRGKEPIIRINGRDSNLTKSEALQMLPSDMIKRIEVTTRPSVKEGETEPIINIITDRKRKGIIGGVNVAFGVPSTAKGGLHLALNKEKINGYGLYGIKREHNISSSREETLRTFNDDAENVEIESNDNNTSSTNQFGEVQYEYLPNKNTELAGNVSVFDSNNSFTTNGIRNISSESLDQTNQFNFTENDVFSIATETEYEQQFNSEKEQLKIELEYEYESRKNLESFSETSISNNDFNTDSSDELRSNEIEFKTRYDWTLNKGDISVGYRFDLSTLDEKQTFFNDLNNISAENNINFTQTDNTIYSDYSNEYKNFYYNIGARLVHTKRKLNDETTNVTSSKSFFNLLPQINLEYEYGDNNAISLNYYSLLRQPRLTYLNSFNTSVDLQRINIGNPNLEPQSTHTIELELFNEFENASMSTTFYTNFITDIIQNVSIYDAENDITVSKPENIGKSTTFGIDFSYSLNAPRWLNTIVKLNGRYGNISGVEVGNNDFYRLNTSLINIVRLKAYKIELSWFYTPKNKINFQTFQNSNQYFKFGLSRRVFKNKGNLVLSVLDPFNSSQIIQTIDGSNFEYRAVIKPNQRRVLLSLFWRFNVKSRFRKTDKDIREKGILQ
ncbi:outer membrane beta-barrel family protein [Psychroserpens sp. AS72]|uniref:outer membrane beta-barrel family protein n=1 Tax=Psychroserpens sp. AS72 TaxID=3135775 RepID=UPI0031710D9E